MGTRCAVVSPAACDGLYFTGFLTLYIAMPIFALTGVVLGVLLIFRRLLWVRVVGTVVGVPILLAGIGVAYVDTWRLWPQTTHGEPLLRATAVILCALVWLTLAALVWLMWRWPSRLRQTGTPTAVSQAPDSP